jgi:hypothetical protein
MLAYARLEGILTRMQCDKVVMGCVRQASPVRPDKGRSAGGGPPSVAARYRASVFARSEATKQSSFVAPSWIASLHTQ